MPPPRVSFPVFERDYYIGILEVDRVFGNFQNAQSLSFDGFGDVYIADADAPGIYKFTRKGDSLHSVIGVGSSHEQFDSPSDIDALLTNSIAVADKNNHRIEIYSRDLIWQASIGGHQPGSKIQFGSPMAVRAASSGYFYLIDGENRRLIGVNPTTGIQQPINTNGSTLGLQFMLAEMEIDIQTSRLLWQKVAWMVDAGQDVRRMASVAKYHATEALSRVADKAVQVAGGMGYMKEYPIERFYRDQRLLRIYEGTSEIQKVIIAGDLLR